MIFHSDRNWLYPLLELEEFVKKKDYDAQTLLVQDKIVGRAAALLLVRLNAGEVRAEKLSVSGKEVLDHYDIPYTHKELLHEVTCQTEKILLNELDPEKAYQVIRQRIRDQVTK